jgi:hypothetical protein
MGCQLLSFLVQNFGNILVTNSMFFWGKKKRRRTDRN